MNKTTTTDEGATRRVKCLLFAALVATLLTATSLAVGQTAASGSEAAKAEARTHFEVAMKFLQGSKYGEAAAELEKSVALYPTKSALFNLGNAYQALHRYVDALRIFRRLETEYAGQLEDDLAQSLQRHIAEAQSLVGRLSVKVAPPDAKVTVNGAPLVVTDEPALFDPSTLLVRAELDGHAAAEQRVELPPGSTQLVELQLSPLPSRLTITVNVAGATVKVDGKPVGTAPLAAPVEVPAGPHTVDVEHPDYPSQHRSVEATPGKAVVVELELRALAAPAPPPPAPEPESKSGVPFWIALGGTAIFAGVSVGTLAAAAGKDGDLQSALGVYEGLPNDTPQNVLDAAYDRAESLQSERDTLHGIGLTTAGVALVGAAVTVWLGLDYFGGSDEEGAPPTARVWPTAGGIAGRF